MYACFLYIYIYIYIYIRIKVNLLGSLITILFFPGSHTGSIQAVGGIGDILRGGGGGSGGRIAIYHNTHKAQSPYRGSLDIWGGDANQGTEPGASGTVYLQNIRSQKSILRVDNKERKQISEDIEIPNEGHRLDLFNPSLRGKSLSYSTNGFIVSNRLKSAVAFF